MYKNNTLAFWNKTKVQMFRTNRKNQNYIQQEIKKHIKPGHYLPLADVYRCLIHTVRMWHRSHTWKESLIEHVHLWESSRKLQKFDIQRTVHRDIFL